MSIQELAEEYCKSSLVGSPYVKKKPTKCRK